VNTLLPAIASISDFDRVRGNPEETWRPAIRQIGLRHGLDVGSICRCPSGENPVFDLDRRFILKLVPNLWAHVVHRDAQCMEFLRCRGGLPTAELIGSGVLEDWSYLISTRLVGRPLDRVWCELPGADREPLARAFGLLLGRLHRVPLDGFKPGGIEWEEFLTGRVNAWPRRRDVAQLPVELRATACDFIEQAGVLRDSSPRVLLHGDLAPENVLVAKIGGAWEFTGLFDFGDALAGRALFDFTATTVLLAKGDADVIRWFLHGYGWGGGSLSGMRGLLMAYTLLHPLAHLPSCLALIPGLPAASSWNEVAERFWPD
jgi:hygromycin-B 7''-O-kinase